MPAIYAVRTAVCAGMTAICAVRTAIRADMTEIYASRTAIRAGLTAIRIFRRMRICLLHSMAKIPGTGEISCEYEYGIVSFLRPSRRRRVGREEAYLKIRQ
jgi:hypothetical protein